MDAVRRGWLPFYPQFNRSPIDLIREAEKAGAKTDQEIIQWVVDQLKDRKLRFAVEDPDAPENWPRVFFIWRGNTLLASAKGHEYFLKHYLGTHTNTIADEIAKDSVREVDWKEPSPQGKMDLVVDINFRMDTSALYSDIVLPAATWYEKEDLNTTDLHSFIHPFGAAVPPCWESRTDWEIFKAIAQKVSELSKIHVPEPFREVVATPLLHDTPDEITQPEVKDWYSGECDPVPGKTMPRLAVVERDYTNLFNRLISFGPKIKNEGIGGKGIRWPVEDLYEDLLKNRHIHEWNGKKYPSLSDGFDAANVILHFAPETNEEVAYRGFKALEERVGLSLADLAEGHRGVKYDFSDLVQQPRRILTSPCWSGIINQGSPYGAYSINVERLVPWRTITGRQSFYLDHEAYIAFEENLPTFKSKIDMKASGSLYKKRDFVNTRPQVSMVFHLDKCIGCHACSIACKELWTDRRGTEYMWWNNVETKPGTGYPTLYEDQKMYYGSWERGKNTPVLRLHSRIGGLKNIFSNPYLPTMDDYYEPWTYRYEDFFNAPPGDDQPVARPISMVTGKHIDIEAGPNWDDDLSGSPIYAANDPNLNAISEEEKQQLFQFERLVFFHLPRICNHCLNPICAAACPAGAVYKRGEDGIVLVSLEKCRAWRMCISGCPYKKVYYNWATGKSEKCILCYPRQVTQQAPACMHSCVGQIRYLGILLYDADRIEETAGKPDKELVDAQRNMILDPFDSTVIKKAQSDGVHGKIIEAAQKSPVYKYVKEWKLALPFHPEFQPFLCSSMSRRFCQ